MPMSAGVNARWRERAGGAPGAAARVQTSALSLAGVYREHADFVWRVARRLGVAEDALEDVVHDVFLIVHRRLDEYDGRAAVTTWLFNLTRGVVSNRRRGRQRAAQRLQGLADQTRASARASESTLAGVSPEAHSERRLAAAFVREFLDGLDAERRLVFELVELDGLKVAEAARHLQINPNTAHSRLRSARAAFRGAVARRLARGDDGPGDDGHGSGAREESRGRRA